jgi:non-ribosomal peptide synthetase component F
LGFSTEDGDCLHRIEGPATPFEPFRLEDIEQSIPARFGRQAERTPDQVAVSGNDETLTYRELDALSNRVAQDIVRGLGAGPEPVALLMDQGVAAVIAILGVLKTGKFYVPLDPELQDGELTAMLQDSGARLIVTARSYGADARSVNGADILHIPSSGRGSTVWCHDVWRRAVGSYRCAIARRAWRNRTTPIIRVDMAHVIDVQPSQIKAGDSKRWTRPTPAAPKATAVRP